MLEEAYDEHKYPTDRVYNVYETDLAIVQTNIPYVIAALTSAESGVTETVIARMSASGNYVAIFPRKDMNDQLMRGAHPGTVGAAYPSGRVQANMFTRIS